MRSKLLVTGAALAAIAAGRPTSADTKPTTPRKPTLAVVIVIDQFRYDYLTRFSDLFDPQEGAFRRFQRDGAFFSEAHYGHATTYTGPGHAHVLTGGYAYRTGMVGNKWFDRASGKSVAIAGDSSAHVLGGGDDSEGTSPRNMIGSTLGDELVQASQGRSRVVTCALKSRAAILLGGKLGKAFWFDEAKGSFTSSTYYFEKELPAFAQEWNKKRLADSFFGKSWTPSVSEEALARAGEDDAPYEGDVAGLGRTFPHLVNGKLAAPGEAYYDALTKTPFGNETLLDFARAAVSGESLGFHGGTDLLGVSLSSNDEVGHTFGPDSREVLDMAVRTDRQLGAFLKWLDERVPGYVAVLTADHGASSIPEHARKLGLPAFRVKKKALQEAAEKALTARFGDGKWVVALEDPSVYLNLELVAEKKLDRSEVEQVVADALTKVPGIAGAFTRTELLRGLPPTALGKSYQVVFHRERSGDVLLVPAPFSIWGKYAEKDWGDSHGSPYEYDTHVPLAFLGSGVATGVSHERVEIADLAPTLAALLGVSAPPVSEGRVLAAVLK